jgi:hypothetical protein
MFGSRPKTGFSGVLLYACVGVLLLSATVQAAHICGLQSPGISISAQNENAASPTNSLCAMCLLIHSVAAVLVLMAVFAPLQQHSRGRSILQVKFIPVLTSFQLYVRPPPAW